MRRSRSWSASRCSSPPSAARSRARPADLAAASPIIMVASCFYCLGSLTVAAARARRISGGPRRAGVRSWALVDGDPGVWRRASPAELRGRLVSCYNLFIVLDGAAACGVNIVCGTTCLVPSARWRVSMGVAAAPAFSTASSTSRSRRAGSRADGRCGRRGARPGDAARARGLLENTYRAGPAAAAGDGAGGRRRRLRPGPQRSATDAAPTSDVRPRLGPHGAAAVLGGQHDHVLRCGHFNHAASRRRTRSR